MTTAFPTYPPNDNRLPYIFRICEPGDLRVIGGNGEAHDLKGFAVMLESVNSTVVWHEFGVVLNLPLEVLIGVNILAFHFCLLPYVNTNRNVFSLKFKFLLAAANISAIPTAALKRN